MMASRPRSILIVRTDKIGDLILSTPAVLSVRRACPDARLLLAVSPYNRPAVSGWIVPDDVIDYDPQWPTARRREVSAAVADVGIDLALVLHPAPDAYRFAWACGARQRVGLVHARRLIDRAAAVLWLTSRVVARVDAAAEHGRPVPHEVELTRAVVERAGLGWSGDQLARPERHPHLEARLDRLLNTSGYAGRRMIGLHLADGWLSEGWALEDVERLLSALAGMDPGLVVVATLGPADTRLAECFRKHPSMAPVVDAPIAGAVAAIGRCALLVPVDYPLWSTVIDRSAVVVTPDTGAVHLASAVGTPVVAVYAPARATVNMGQFAPWRVPARGLVRAAPDATIPAIREAVTQLLAESLGHQSVGRPAVQL